MINNNEMCGAHHNEAAAVRNGSVSLKTRPIDDYCPGRSHAEPSARAARVAHKAAAARGIALRVFDHLLHPCNTRLVENAPPIRAGSLRQQAILLQMQLWSSLICKVGTVELGA